MGFPKFFPEEEHGGLRPPNPPLHGRSQPIELMMRQYIIDPSRGLASWHGRENGLTKSTQNTRRDQGGDLENPSKDGGDRRREG